MKKNLAARRIASILIVRQSAAEPTDDEWNELVKMVAGFDPKLKVLIITDGGGSSPSQRKSLAAALGGRHVRLAIVTESLKMRFVASSMALFNSGTATFLPSEMAQAFKHLEISKAEQETAISGIRELTALVG